jgi:hypothetical protein
MNWRFWTCRAVAVVAQVLDVDGIDDKELSEIDADRLPRAAGRPHLDGEAVVRPDPGRYGIRRQHVLLTKTVAVARHGRRSGRFALACRDTETGDCDSTGSPPETIGGTDAKPEDLNSSFQRFPKSWKSAIQRP